MRFAFLLAASLLCLAAGTHAQVRAVVPQKTLRLQVMRLGSPGIDTGDYGLCVWTGTLGRPDGGTPPDFCRPGSPISRECQKLLSKQQA